MKQLRDHCKNCVGQPVVVHHKNGKVYHGVLQTIDNRGMYIRQHHGHVSFEQTDHAEQTVNADQMEALQPELAFFLGGLAFGIGAGIGLGLTFLPWAAVGRFYGGGVYW
ncbi:MAG: hypothetical protein ACXVP2_11310 [Tumebacillaceae bacterium]